MTADSMEVISNHMRNSKNPGAEDPRPKKCSRKADKASRASDDPEKAPHQAQI